MGAYVVAQLVKAMTKQAYPRGRRKVLVMGLTFKENCPDLRNTRVIDMVTELRDYNCVVDVFDPWADAAEAQREYGISLVAQPQEGAYDAIILAVAHHQFKDMGEAAIRKLGAAPPTCCTT
jgi:UDP-N-acetyl-D-galactosamine dehydrogenase